MPCFPRRTLAPLLASALMLAGAPALAQAPAPPAEAMQPTVAAYRSAWLVVFGKAASDEQLAQVRPHVTCDVPASDVIALRACMNPARLTWTPVTFSEAVADLKSAVLAPANVLARAELIDRAYFNAMGRVSTADEQLYWENRIRQEKLWYAAVANACISWVNNPANRATERTATIQRAYQASLGRAASPSDVAYWLNRSEHYLSMVNADRDWLYGPGLDQELTSVVRRAADARAGHPASEGEVKALLVKALLNRATYERMLSL
jgi:hypothetical protein